MRVIAKRTLKLFWDRHPAARVPLQVWYQKASAGSWSGPADVKRDFGTTVDFISDNRLIFDIGGNKYRLIVHVAYKYKTMLIKFIGTHKDYDAIDPETI